MRWAGRLGAALPASVVVLVASCGSAPTPAASATTLPSSPESPVATPVDTPPPETTAVASATELRRLAALVYPPCTPSTCAASSMFTSCDAGSAGADVFGACPLTPRLASQLRDDVAGDAAAPDPLGGGLDPEWTTEVLSAVPSPNGGVVHVVLGSAAGTERLDLLMVVVGSQLLVDDVSCTGNGQDSADGLGPDWLLRSACSS